MWRQQKKHISTLSHAAAKSAALNLVHSDTKKIRKVNFELCISLAAFFSVNSIVADEIATAKAFNSGLMKPPDKLVPGPLHGDLIHSATSLTLHFSGLSNL